MLSGESTHSGATSQRHFREPDRLCGPSEFIFFCKQLQKFLPGGVGHHGGHLNPDFLSKLPGSWPKCQSLDPSQTKQSEPPGLRTRHQGHLKLLWAFLNGPAHTPLQADGETEAWRGRGLTQGLTGAGGFQRQLVNAASVRTDEPVSPLVSFRVGRCGPSGLPVLTQGPSAVPSLKLEVPATDPGACFKFRGGPSSSN